MAGGWRSIWAARWVWGSCCCGRSLSPVRRRKIRASTLQELAQIRSERFGFTPMRERQLERLGASSYHPLSCWGLFLAYFCQGFPIYFYHTWFFQYLIQVRHLSITQTGLWGATPYLAIAVLAPLGGLLFRFRFEMFRKRWGRRAAVGLGMCFSAVLLWVGSSTGEHYGGGDCIGGRRRYEYVCGKHFLGNVH